MAEVDNPPEAPAAPPPGGSHQRPGKAGSAVALDQQSPRDIRKQLGLRPIINVSGTMTSLGASIVPPEVVAAVAAVLPQFVEIDDLQVLRHFESLELAYSNGLDIVTHDVCQLPISECARLVVGIPPARRAHWYAEFKRLGLSIEPPKPKPDPRDPAHTVTPAAKVEPAKSSKPNK